MKVNAFAKIGTVICSAAIAAATLVAAPAAFADPGTAPSATTLVGFGSDTTQDVMNEIASAIGGGKLASFNALGDTTTVTARPGGPTNVPRANGSGEGYKLLKVATGFLETSAVLSGTAKASVTANAANSLGQIDYARSSSGVTTQDANGAFTFIPFALDSVTLSANVGDAAATIPLTLGASGDLATTPSIYSIYHCTARYVYTNTSTGAYDSVGATAGDAPAGTTATELKPLLPAYGSGTRKYFLSKIGITDTSSVMNAYGCVSAVDGASAAINENNGTATAAIGAGALAPYSIGQYVAQAKTLTTGVTDVRHDTVLLNVGGIAPTTGSGSTLAPNPDYAAMVRKVYNIVPSRLADDATSRIHEMFVGTDSLVCQQTASIEKMGFVVMTGTGSNACGDTSAREGVAVAISGSTQGALSASSINRGQSVTALVTVGTTTHTQGGTVNVYNGEAVAANLVGTATIAAGETSATVTITPTASGTAHLTTVFVPALPGIATTTVASAVDLAVIAHSDTWISVKRTANMDQNIRVVAWVNTDVYEGGTLTLKDGDTTVATATLAADESAEVFTFKAIKSSYALKVVFGGSASVPTSQSSVVNVAVTKLVTTTTPAIATPTTTNAFAAYTASGFFAKISKASTKAARLKITVAAAGTVKPTGTITVTIGTTQSGGSALVITGGTLVSGVATITLPRANTWGVTGTAQTRYITITYSGDDRNAASSIVKKFQVNN